MAAQGEAQPWRFPVPRLGCLHSGNEEGCGVTELQGWGRRWQQGVLTTAPQGPDRLQGGGEGKEERRASQGERRTSLKGSQGRPEPEPPCVAVAGGEAISTSIASARPEASRPPSWGDALHLLCAITV